MTNAFQRWMNRVYEHPWAGFIIDGDRRMDVQVKRVDDLRDVVADLQAEFKRFRHTTATNVDDVECSAREYVADQSSRMAGWIARLEARIDAIERRLAVLDALVIGDGK